MSVSNTNKPSQTDWARVDAMTDEEIDTSDIPPLTDDFFKKAKLWMPKDYVVKKNNERKKKRKASRD